MKKAKRVIGMNRRDVIGLLVVTPTIASSSLLADGLGDRTDGVASISRTAEAAIGSKATGANRDLATLAANDFEPLVGSAFIVGDDEAMLDGIRHGHSSCFREQFALVFSTPLDASVRLEPVPVSHPAIGRHDLLVTQVMDRTGKSALEICFG